MSSRVIPNVPRVAYFIGDTSYLTPFIGSLWALNRAIGGEESYSDVLALSGAGNRLRWAKGWDPSNVDIAQCDEYPFAMHLRALRALGLRGDFRLTKPLSGQSGPLVDEETALREIVRSIDEGMPVLALGVIGPPEGCVITGYEDDGRTLLGWNYFQADFGLPAEEYFHKPNWYAGMWGYVTVDRAPKPDIANSAIDMLRAAASIARMDSVRGAKVGLAAWSVWMDQLEFDDFSGLPVTLPDGPGAGDVFWYSTLHGRFMVYCDGLCQVHERGITAEFYERLATAVPAWTEELTAAAAHLRTCARYGGFLWNYLTMDEAGYQKFAQPEIRKILADEGRRAMVEDQAAVLQIERLLARIGHSL